MNPNDAWIGKVGRSVWTLTALFVVSTLTAAENPPPSYRVTDLLTASSPSASRDAEWKPGEGIALEVGGMEWMGEDRLAVAIRKGEVWMIDGVLSDDPAALEFSLFASGLHEPLGLLRDGEDLLVAQRAEITRLRDRDGDGLADAYLSEASGWGVTGSYHAYVYGPERDGRGNLWITLNLDLGDHADNTTGWRGWGGVLGDNGDFTPMAAGMRSPCGLGANAAGDMFFSDQQGTWIPATPIYHLREGVFYGNQEGLGSSELPGAPVRMAEPPARNQPYPEAIASVPEFVPPALWLPYNKMGRSATDIQLIDAGGSFGPFDGQLLVGEFTNAAINRVFLEKVDGQYQGACFPFLEGFPAAVVRLAFAPNGSLFAGMTNRGWSSLGNRSYGLQRVDFTGETPFAIQEMRALPDGFELRFTRSVDRASITAPGALEISSFTYEYSSAYGGEEIDTRQLTIAGLELSPDGMRATLRVEGLRELHVHELRTTGIRSVDGSSLDHENAWYTLNRIPGK